MAKLDRISLDLIGRMGGCNSADGDWFERSAKGRGPRQLARAFRGDGC